MTGIYKITSPSNKVYIGQSVDIEKRFNNYNKLYNCKNQIRLYNSFIKYNPKNHIFEILCECDINNLNDKERYYQDLYNSIGKNGLNCKLTKSKDKSGYISEDTKFLMKGKRNLSDEQRKKMAINLKNQQQLDPNWFNKSTKGIIGRKKTDEERLKISIANTGKKASEETRLKMSIAKKNMSDETKIKIGLISKGRKQSKETIEKRILKIKGLKGKLIINTETKEQYIGIRIVANLFGYKYNSLANMLNGHRKNNTNFKYI